MLKQYIKDVCEILGINPPCISFDTSSFRSETMLAQCSPDGKTIYIKKYEKINADILFYIAHELRHIWQLETNENFYFSKYKPVDLIGSIEKYNLQIAEVDAHAFGALVMMDFFGVKPLFLGLSDNVKNKINKRMEIIKTEFFQ